MTKLTETLKWTAATLTMQVGRISETIANWTWFVGPTSYQPEAHYMRGPGPKWRAKHGIAAPAFARSGRASDQKMI